MFFSQCACINSLPHAPTNFLFHSEPFQEKQKEAFFFCKKKKMSSRLTLILALVALMCVVVKAERPTAVAFIRETNPTQHLIMGQVYFYQDNEDEDVRVEAFIYGNENYLPKNSDFSMIIHEYGDITSRNGRGVGPEFETGSEEDHGCPNDKDRKTGGLGNFRVNDHHVLLEGKTVNLITTFNSTKSIIGRAIVLGKEEDTCKSDFKASPLAFGTIGLARNAPHDVGVTLRDEDTFLTTYVTGSSHCERCEGEMWVVQEDSNNVRVRGKVSMPVQEPNGHQFVITQYGDITTRNGALMGDHWQDPGQRHALPNTLNAHNGDLGNNQYYVEYGVDDEFTDVWIDVVIKGRVSEIAGRAVQVYESWDRGEECPPNGGGGRLMAFGVFGIGNPDNEMPSLPPRLENVGPLDRSFCAGGFVGAGVVTLVGVLLGLFLVM